MENLTIQNFVCIKDVSVELKPMTVIIGPQASGKSIIAKLVYFFRHMLADQVFRSVAAGSPLSDYKKLFVATFEIYFPRYIWQHSDFSISYVCGDTRIAIKHTSSGNRLKTTVELSAAFETAYRKALAEYKHRVENATAPAGQDPLGLLREQSAAYEAVYAKPNAECRIVTIFIPAARSFFANLQRNVFTFLNHNVAIDPFISQFGAYYEAIKAQQVSFYPGQRLDPSSADVEIERLSEKILKGKYVPAEGRDWIESDTHRINVSHASSGQQEALPLLLVLARNRLHTTNGVRTALIIEEPEAHLFPTSQADLVNLFALICNTRSQSILMTTHSPYILTALNNLMIAHAISSEGNENTRRRAAEIVPQNQQLAFENVAAYSISEGTATSILAEDTKTIGTTIIDSVSEDFGGVLDALLEISSQ